MTIAIYFNEMPTQ